MNSEQRIYIKADNAWRFCIDDKNIGLSSRWYDYGIPRYAEVKIPHTFNVDAATQNYRGVAWYEYHFTPDSSWVGKQVYIQFNGVYRDTNIWVNGIEIGQHYNSGFTTFQVDTKDTVRVNENNTLTLRVDNAYSKNAIPIENSFDWTDDGGIFRKVTFIVVNPGAINYVKLDAQPIIQEYGNRMKEAEATLNATVYLYPHNKVRYDNKSTQSDNHKKPCYYEYRIYEGMKENKRILMESSRNSIDGEEVFNISSDKFENVKLWHFDEPILYTIIINLIQDDSIYDFYEINFGFREFISRNNRWYLNGEPVRLVGTEWMPGSNPHYGNAELEEYMIKILTQLKESNCIFTRFHWQQDDFIYEWCDQNGLLVQEEVPNWGSREQTEWQLKVSKSQADEMIQYHYNHPCIISWGIANELKGQDDKTKQMLSGLKEYFKTLDQFRMANYVTCTMWENPSNDATAIGDSLWVNDYIGTWHGDLDNKEQLTKIITAHPDKPLIISEFGLCEPAYTGGDKRRIEIIREKLDVYRNFRQIAGIIYFCLNDYRTQMGEEGEGVLKRRVHGSTDIFGEPKPSYYEVQMQYSPIKIINVVNNTIFLQAVNDLPCYELDGYYIQAIGRKNNGYTNYRIPKLLPGDTCKINFQMPEESIEFFRIYRPTGYLVGEYRFNKINND